MYMNLTPLFDVLQTGTPIAVFVTLVGLAWQFMYTHSRNKLQDAQQQRTLALEREKFKHQEALEAQRFEYEQLRWREELGRDMMIKLLEERVTAYTQLWGYIEVASTSRNKDRSRETAQDIAREVQKWRYGKGGLLAEDITRDAVYEFQRALWHYDGSSPSYRAMRTARKFVLRSLRADLGLGKNVSGETIYQIIGARQEIRQELDAKFPTTGERDS